MHFYAHTKNRPDGTPAAQSEWEPLFTPFGEAENQCQRDTCKKCESMHPQHGHLNKVAYHHSSTTDGKRNSRLQDTPQTAFINPPSPQFASVSIRALRANGDKFTMDMIEEQCKCRRTRFPSIVHL